MNKRGRQSQSSIEPSITGRIVPSRCGLIGSVTYELTGLKTLEGSGPLRTSACEVRCERWRLSYEVTSDEPEYSIFTIYVHDTSGKIVSILHFNEQEGRGETIIESKPGFYYLNIISANNDWTVVIGG